MTAIRWTASVVEPGTKYPDADELIEPGLYVYAFDDEDDAEDGARVCLRVEWALDGDGDDIKKITAGGIVTILNAAETLRGFVAAGPSEPTFAQKPRAAAGDRELAGDSR